MPDNWLMGSLAAQDDYKPMPWGSDPWQNRLGPTREMLDERKADETSQRAQRIYDEQQAANADPTQAFRGMPRLDPGLRRAPGSVAAEPRVDALATLGGELLTDPTNYMPGLGGAKGVAAMATMGSVLNSDEARADAGSRLGRALIRRASLPTREYTSPGWAMGKRMMNAAPIENVQTVTDAQRMMYPGVYAHPKEIVSAADRMVAPEHPAMKELFNVTRDDLYEISKQGRREGNVDPNIVFPKKPGSSYAAENVMNDRNAQRILDVMEEAKKSEGLTKGMVPWYVMDPAFQRMVQLVGKDRAVAEYNQFNSMMTPFSSSSAVTDEINRGTAARMMAKRGRYEEFADQAGMPVEARGRNFPPEMADVIPHVRHSGHINPARKFWETGSHGYAPDTVKIPLYTQASGVPQTGFQTKWPVPDAHFTRASGMADTRMNKSPGDYMGGPEYRTFAPWFRESVAGPAGIEPVSAQALMWGAFAPQTGVKTAIGAPKLELLSQKIWERAQKLGVDPRDFRDKVLRGEEHSFLSPAMGDLADTSRYG